MKKDLTPLTEKEIERLCIDFYRRMGCYVVEFSQPHRARGQTLGIADLRVYSKWGIFWHEVKRPTGKQSPGQIKFEINVTGFGDRYIVGGLNTAIFHINEIAGKQIPPVVGHT